MYPTEIHVGHPVNVANGSVYSMRTDISVGGKIRLVWGTRYSTGLLEPSCGPLPSGPGWTCRYFSTLTYVEGAFHLVTPEGSTEIFEDPNADVDRGAVIRNLGTFQELAKRGDFYILTRWDVGNGLVERYAFSAGARGRPWPLVRIENVIGQALELVHDDQGRLVAVRQELERRSLAMSYNPAGLIESIALLTSDRQRQALVHYEYDAGGRLASVRDALGQTDRYEYDVHGRIVRDLPKDGGVFSFRYDDQGRCVRTSGLDRYDEKSLRFMPTWTEVTDSLGRTSCFQHLPSGQVVTMFDPLGRCRQIQYDDQGRIRAKVGPDGGTTAYEYDAFGNRCKVTDPAGRAVLLRFNRNHQLTEMVDPAGNLWRREYDSSNRMTMTADPLGRSWRFEYDLNGNMVRMIDPAGRHRVFKYSAANEMTEATDWAGNATRFRVNPRGEVVERERILGVRTRFSYDALGRLIRVDYPDGTHVSCQIDAGGNRVALVDRSGRTYRNRYGPCGRLLEMTDPLGQAVKLEWDTEPNRLLRVVNKSGETHHFRHDASGHLVGEVGFDGRETVYEYNKFGASCAAIDGLGLKTTFGFDRATRTARRTYPDGESSAYVYDALGNLAFASSPGGELQFERDALGRVVRETQGDVIIERDYGLDGYLIAIRTSLGLEVSYAHDPNGRLNRVVVNRVHEFNLKRDALGRETLRLLPGGLRMACDHDAEGRMTFQRVKGRSEHGGLGADPRIASEPPGETIVGRRFGYEPGGNLAVVEDDAWGTTKYLYDPASRLVLARRETGAVEQFEYDACGNIISTHGPDARPIASEYGPGNRLLKRGDTAYRYDGDGRLIGWVRAPGTLEESEWRLTWSGDNRLAALTSPDGTEWRYAYDALGRRVSKQGPGRITRFVWLGNSIIQLIEDAELAQSWVYLPASATPICMVDPRGAYSVICDHLGTPRELVDSAGTVAWAAAYSSWGTIDRSCGTGVKCHLRFPGQWFDEESGLCYNRFRYYDPECGRFISPDPIGLQGGLNEYRYGPDPINWMDPLGLQGGPPQITDADRDFLRNSTQTINNADPYGQRVVATGLAHDPDDPNAGLIPVYAVNRDGTSPDTRDAADALGFMRVTAKVGDEGRGPVGAPMDAEQLLMKGCEANGLELLAAAPSIPACPDCQDAMAEEGVEYIPPEDPEEEGEC